MKAVFALFLLLISVVSFASNPDEILQPPTAFEEDYRKEHEIPPPHVNEDTLIQGEQPHHQSQQADQGQPKSALDQSAEGLERDREPRNAHERYDYGEPQNDPRHEMGIQHNGGLKTGGHLPPHAQPHRGMHPLDGRSHQQQAPFSAE